MLYFEPVAHTGFSYGVGTVSSPGPYPEKAPPLFLFSSKLRCIIFQNHTYLDHVLHPSEDIYKREEERARSGPFTVRWHKMNDMICVIS